jgi:hypothetical protein
VDGYLSKYGDPNNPANAVWTTAAPMDGASATALPQPEALSVERDLVGMGNPLPEMGIEDGTVGLGESGSGGMGEGLREGVIEEATVSSVVSNVFKMFLGGTENL